jgi:hypothetical protein
MFSNQIANRKLTNCQSLCLHLTLLFTFDLKQLKQDGNSELYP